VPQADWLAECFEHDRASLRAVAYRMLGSLSEANDAVQEAWLRISRADAIGVDNLGGWLTTVVTRVCLNALRARSTRREEPEINAIFGPERLARLDLSFLTPSTPRHLNSV
jgi:RNA polymerase sigma-70 factor, ECF subfamily